MWIDGGVCKNSEPVRWNENGPLPLVLTGTEPSFRKMNRQRLESLVTRLILFTCSDTENEVNLARPKWWPDYLAFAHPISALRSQTKSFSMKWNDILRDVIGKYSQFYKCATLPSRSSLDISRWPQPYKGKILAPKQDCENVILGKRKLESDEDGWVIKKKPKIDPELAEQERSEHNISPVVKLFDIVNLNSDDDVEVVETPVTQTYFMNCFGLRDNTSNLESCYIPPKLLHCRINNVPQIPFSSDLGLLIMKREGYSVPEGVHLRKNERLEWYLKEQVPIPKNKLEFEVTFDKKQCWWSHEYKFPKKQHSQTRMPLLNVPFLLSICRPVSVQLTRIDPSAVIAELKRNSNVNHVIDKELKVVIPKLTFPHEKGAASSRRMSSRLKRVS